jgi:hypothetical protein
MHGVSIFSSFFFFGHERLLDMLARATEQRRQSSGAAQAPRNFRDFSPENVICFATARMFGSPLPGPDDHGRAPMPL